MKTTTFAAALLFGIASTAAHASTWDYSYTFYGGDVVAGSFAGDAANGIIENISAASMTFNGTSIFSNSPAQADLGAGPAFISVDGTSYDFTFEVNAGGVYGSANNPFADPVGGSQADHFGAFVMDLSGAVGNPILHNDLEPLIGQNVASLGKLTITAVPEPASAALLLAGLGFVGVGAKRRRS